MVGKSPMDRHGRHRRLPVAGIVAILTLGAGILAGGCGKPLLSPLDERSQYDRYDRVRNKYAPQYVMDEFGRERPNLRGRLAPKR